MATFTHDPDADLDYGWTWNVASAGKRAWLSDGETITASTWSVTLGEPTDLTLHDSTHDDTTTTVWVQGGVLGKDYKITNHVVSSAGREDDRTHTLNCRNR